MDEISAINQIFIIIQKKTLTEKVYVKNLFKNAPFKNRCNISIINQELYNEINNTFSRNFTHPKIYASICKSLMHPLLLRKF